jgi:dolichol-phosphate mannosyltransferase
MQVSHLITFGEKLMFAKTVAMEEEFVITPCDYFAASTLTTHYPAVILPTYCEAENIERLIQSIQKLGINPLIVVIDDSSPDGTSDVVARLQEKYDNILLMLRPTKRGLGSAITEGFRLLLSLPNPPDYIVTMDADYSHNPEDIPKLIESAKKGYDLVIGSRYCRGGETVGWHFARLLISRCANLIASTVVGMRLDDCTSGFRCYTSRYVKDVLENLHSQTYEIQIETVKQAGVKGFQVKEIPITFVNRKRGKSKLTKNEVQSFLSYIIKTKFCDWMSFRVSDGERPS